MRAPPFARIAAVAAPSPDAEPVTIAHKPSADIAFPCCDFGQAIGAELPYRARKYLQIGKTPLRGIRALSSESCPGLYPGVDTGSRAENASKQKSRSRSQDVRRTSALVMAVGVV